jgi:transposase-like protein
MSNPSNPSHRADQSKSSRRHYSAEEKVAILRRQLLEGVPVSDVCEQHGIHPTLFYRWQKEFFENDRGRVHLALRRPVRTRGGHCPPYDLRFQSLGQLKCT